MSGFSHLKASYSAELAISAETFFDAASDWQGILGILPPEHPFKFTHVDLAEGSSRGQTPCTRLMHLDKSTLAPEVASAMPDMFRETLLVADREAGTLIYRVEGATLGMRNYYGVKDIEPIDGNRCRVTITARFDFPSDADGQAIIDALIEVYKGVVHGAERARQQA